MAIKTEQLQQICNDLIDLLKQRLPNYNPDLIQLLGQQYFMGTLSRLVSLSKQIEKEGTVPDFNKLDLHFSLTYPEDAELIQVEKIREESAKIMSGCLDSLSKNIIN